MSALRIHNPATGELIESLIADTADSVGDKFKESQQEQRSWEHTPLEERSAAIERFISLLRSHQEDLARVLTEEMGKPLHESRSELAAVCERVQYFIDAMPDELQPRIEKDNGKVREEVRSEALGVVGVISAWNFPWFVGANALIPALLGGNAVLYKPSEYATRTGLRFVNLLVEAGVPHGVIQHLIGYGEVGEELCKQPLDALCFTGSLATGRHIARSLAEHNPFCRSQFELGGKDGVYVCDDVNVQQAASSLASGAFYNAGQSCCSVERIFVEKGIAEEFEDAFVAKARELRCGHPNEADTDVAPLARPGHLEYLLELISDANQKGARVLCGGSPVQPEGLHPILRPTVITDTHEGMRLAREEIFGPMVTLQVVDDDEEAISELNRSEFGLTAGVYSEAHERAEHILSQVRSGSAYWNACDRVSPRLPWTARGLSGSGYTLGLEGIRNMLFRRSWHFVHPE